ncbi:MAG TPA: DUF3179 domain-containing (seleno)protein [Patescibacteria group bacterium]|nr:DUF3179 domain-containing (seleno)protein [Patescibacteria group bacterium]
MRRPVLLMLAAVVLAACSGPMDATPNAAPIASSATAWPDPPPAPSGALEADVAQAVEQLVAAPSTAADADALATVAASGDPRLAWLLSDLLRMAVTPDAEAALVDASRQLIGADPADPRFGANAWLALTNLLIGWDLPAPPGYREHKAELLLRLEPGWEPLFADPDGTLDWRHVTWGGVFMDTRPSGSAGACDRACIPSLDDPALTPAAEGGWYPDDRTVFGIVLDGEAVALPKHIMEVHELAHLTLAGRRIGVPYCTLCASAHAFFVDGVAPGGEPLVLRTSGLLSRSNKVMVDLASGSAFHTFTGRAATGPLREAGVVLEPLTVTVTSWGEWRAMHPATRIVARDGGIGRAYPDDPLCGRDDAGTIFPTGPSDTRLPAQAAVIGVVGPGERPVAFHADAARAELAAGRPVSLGGVELHGGDLRAVDEDGRELVSQQSFWFAWSQFHPSTSLWAPATAATGASPGNRTGAAEGCWGVIDPLDR